MTTIHTAQRTTTASGRARRTDRVIPVISIAADSGADAASSAELDLHGILADTLESTRAASTSAEQELRAAEVERSRAARALEHGISPMTIDEAGRAALRATYAAADSVVADKAVALDRARTVEAAAKTIAETIAAVDADNREVADQLTATLALWQSSRPGESQASRGRSGARLRRI